MDNSGRDCFKCLTLIPDDNCVTLTDGKIYHPSCVKCTHCGEGLTERIFRANDGQLYCMNDSYSLFGPPCGSCFARISQKEFSVYFQPKDRYFHYNCLRCSVCLENIPEGDNLGFGEDNELLCEVHYYLSKCEVESEDRSISPANSVNSTDSDDKDSKRRGPRTTIKPGQLEVLMNVFTKNPKPTRAVREMLSKETGLKMRVIQVWFQNKRSKEKRISNHKYSKPIYGSTSFPFFPYNQQQQQHTQHQNIGHPYPSPPFEAFQPQMNHVIINQ